MDAAATPGARHAFYSRQIGEILTSCGVRYPAGREWEYLSTIIEDTGLRSSDNPIDPFLISQLLDAGLFVVLRNVLDDEHVLVTPSDFTDGGPPERRRKTLVGLRIDARLESGTSSRINWDLCTFFMTGHTLDVRRRLPPLHHKDYAQSALL